MNRFMLFCLTLLSACYADPCPSKDALMNSLQRTNQSLTERLSITERLISPLFSNMSLAKLQRLYSANQTSIEVLNAASAINSNLSIHLGLDTLEHIIMEEFELKIMEMVNNCIPPEQIQKKLPHQWEVLTRNKIHHWFKIHWKYLKSMTNYQKHDHREWRVLLYKVIPSHVQNLMASRTSR